MHMRMHMYVQEAEDTHMYVQEAEEFKLCIFVVCVCLIRLPYTSALYVCLTGGRGVQALHLR